MFSWNKICCEGDEKQSEINNLFAFHREEYIYIYLHTMSGNEIKK